MGTMITRREAIVAGAALPTLPAWSEPPAARHVDREVMLKVSDRLRSQTWTYAGQTWTELRSKLVLHEGEFIRIAVINDTDEPLGIGFGDESMQPEVEPRRTMSRHMVISLERSPAITMGVFGRDRDFLPVVLRSDVRPSNGAHPNVI